MVSPLTKELEHHGVVVIRDLFSPEQLRGMQEAFALRLRRQRWNDLDGYEKTESYRHMVQDVLALHQGFIDVALHPRIVEAVRHGMTIGELAKLFNEEKHIDADLTVVPMRGWLRGDWYDSTGATWMSRNRSHLQYQPEPIRPTRPGFRSANSAA